MSDDYKHSIKKQLEQHGIKYWFIPPINYLTEECKKHHVWKILFLMKTIWNILM
ncbi:hypothetical protein QJS64_17185 [Paraclostridium bifermentans]|uniref:Uncharacterized protein n=1 Tax=Paraclostridium bifermentans TaxID=1490 RepID=A0ABY8R2I4_PARBF|nr:hypothetical protein QJS64_17185 [Paraclostridium bifermentans]